jgi:hypothetical protein
MIGSLFVRAKTREYHFGDYFDAGQRTKYVPWFDYRVNKVNYDANYNYYRTAYSGHKEWDRNLRALYRGRYDKEVPRPPRTLVQQNKVVNNITVNKTKNTVVNKNINITNIQNLTVVQSIKNVKNFRTTGMASLANIRPEETKKAPINRQFRVEQVRKEHVAEEKKQVERYRAVAHERQAREVKMATKTTAAKLTAPVKVKAELPDTVPPRRVRSAAVKPPPPPVQPKIDPKGEKRPKVDPKPDPKPPVKPKIDPKDERPPVRPKVDPKPDPKPPVKPKDEPRKDTPPPKAKDDPKPPPKPPAKEKPKDKPKDKD